MQHHRQKKAGQIAVSGRLLVATVVGACSSPKRVWEEKRCNSAEFIPPN
jgi:hypothetical protein